ncbi:MAG: hypothetical protein H8Z69_01895 [Nanohaloarchaea archaeon]|nr:hypothetical protein [Candidatus Nanohaloarchaea archaeon]
MQRALKGEWLDKYNEIDSERIENTIVLTAYNANIDVISRVEDLNLEISEVNPKLHEKINTKAQLEQALKYCMENEENHEIDKGSLEYEPEGDARIGGQAGIVANLLSRIGSKPIFYTPLLSEELTSVLDNEVSYPKTGKNRIIEEKVNECANSTRTKKNLIFEFQSGRTGRLILSDTLKGFGPYFNSDLEDNISELDAKIDCGFLSGFHNVTGNKESKIKKSERQLKAIESPLHLEFAYKGKEIAELMLDFIVPEVDSIGVDENEIHKILEIKDIEASEDLDLVEGFEKCSQLLEKLNISRIHFHGFSYHLIVAEEGYSLESSKIRDSMLLGEMTAIQEAETGKIPSKRTLEKFDSQDENLSLKGIEQLSKFEEVHDIEKFGSKGFAEIEGKKVAAIPILIHQDPEKTVGMGDIISATTFTSENS